MGPVSDSQISLLYAVGLKYVLRKNRSYNRIMVPFAIAMRPGVAMNISDVLARPVATPIKLSLTPVVSRRSKGRGLVVLSLVDLEKISRSYLTELWRITIKRIDKSSETSKNI